MTPNGPKSKNFASRSKPPEQKSNSLPPRRGQGIRGQSPVQSGPALSAAEGMGVIAASGETYPNLLPRRGKATLPSPCSRMGDDCKTAIPKTLRIRNSLPARETNQDKTGGKCDIPATKGPSNATKPDKSPANSTLKCHKMSPFVVVSRGYPPFPSPAGQFPARAQRVTKILPAPPVLPVYQGRVGFGGIVPPRPETVAKLPFPPLGEKSFPRRREPIPFPLDGGRLEPALSAAEGMGVIECLLR